MVLFLSLVTFNLLAVSRIHSGTFQFSISCLVIIAAAIFDIVWTVDKQRVRDTDRRRQKAYPHDCRRLE